MDRPISEEVLALTRAVGIAAVRMVRSSSELRGVRAGDVLERLRLDTKVGGVKSPDLPQGVRALVSLNCTLMAVGDDREVAKVSCEFALDYVVNDAALFERLSEDDLTQFAALNGVYNAWPYMREFCQTISSRMGLPVPILLPSLPPNGSAKAAGTPEKPE